MSVKINEHNFKTPEQWDIILMNEFQNESDRAAVIVTSSLFDTALHSLLKNCFVPIPTSTDNLFDSPNSPLSTFSSKIDICFRISLISSKFCRDLHLIRKIRNEFAHNIHGCTFENCVIRQRVLELAKSSNVINKCPKQRKIFGKGTRGDFLMIASWMLWSLNSLTEYVDSIEECDLEFGYCEFIKEELEKIKKKNKRKKRNKSTLLARKAKSKTSK